ncbi:hypothetical protein Tco_1395242 [Tanacetum coccineum]
MAIQEPWRQSHLLPPSPPLSPNSSPTNSPTITNSLSPPSPPQNPLRNQIVNELNELHHLSNLIDINLQHAINATTQTPPSPPLILPATLDQVNFHLEFCHCCMHTQTLFNVLRDDLNRIKSIIIGPSTQIRSSPNNPSPTSSQSPRHY